MIFVTGGTGFLGRHLIPVLCRAGLPVRVLTRQPEAHPWLKRYPSVEVAVGDLRDRDSLVRALDGCDTLIHAGGLFRFWGDAQHFDETNALGTENVMSAAAAAGIRKAVHVSSIAVIGLPDPTHIIDETYPPNPVDPYQHSKLHSENIALAVYRAQGLPVVVVRPGAFYGPMGEYGFNRLFFKDPMRGIIMQMDGGRYIIFPAYIGDVARGLLLALEHGRPGEIYNICGDCLSHYEVYTQVMRAANLHYPRLNLPGWMGTNFARLLEAVAGITGQEPFYPINLYSYVYNNWRVSIEKARRELQFEPTPFDEGARRTVAWYRARKPDHIPELDC
ncbi:MAG: NAD-dependent epimerase/dehydratase family protein [Armatimonadetes bacterium]|nr:NAD-dependent epimerase/dehydratase family protein [Anaerolineae bacterium]